MSDSFAPDETPLSVDVVRGDPTPAEVAALLAVVGEAYSDEADTAAAARTRSRWELTARRPRTPLDSDRGWTGFAG